MATHKVIHADERLDTIVLNYYGSLNPFDAVLLANPQLSSPMLAVGDVIELPKIKLANVEDTLW